MTSSRLTPSTLSDSVRHGIAWAWFGVIVSLAAPLAASGQTGPVPAAPGARATGSASWSSLNPSQKNALKPLEREWDRIDPARKTKWLEIANRFPSMSAAEQQRIQNRMTDWATMTPRERGQARMNFKEAQQVPAQERKARWEAYKALPPEQQKQLAARAAPVPRKAAAADASPEGSGSKKSNVVPNSSYAPRPKAVSPSVAQAQPGATTNLITKRPSPPPHQPSGLPKIAVTPGFVDQATLLPKRGPQGAATRSAPASAPGSRKQ